MDAGAKGRQEILEAMDRLEGSMERARIFRVIFSIIADAPEVIDDLMEERPAPSRKFFPRKTLQPRERPEELRQTVLDMRRVFNEPCPFGSGFLNGEKGYLVVNMPDDASRFGYAALTSGEGQGFTGFWSSQLLPYLDECGYEIDKADVVFAAVSAGEERCGPELAAEVDGVLSEIKSQAHAGYLMEPELYGRLRLSLWFFTPIDKLKRKLH